MTEIYSTDTDSGTISVLENDGKSVKKIASIQVGNAPRGSVRFTSDGRGYVSNTSTNTVSEIDGLTHEETRRIQVGNGPRGLFIVGKEKYLLVSNSGSDTLSIVDLEYGEDIRQVEIGRDPRHMIVADGFAYISLWGEGSIAKVDVSPLDGGDVDGVKVVNTIMLAPDTFPYSLNIDNTRGLAFVACNAIQNIPVIDLATDRVCADIPVRAGGVRAVTFTPDHKYALASLERDNSVAVIDIESLSVARYIDAGPAPRGVVSDSEGTIYAAAFSRNTVMKLDIPDWGSHGVTVIRTADADLSDPNSEVATESVPVGFGHVASRCLTQQLRDLRVRRKFRRWYPSDMSPPVGDAAPSPSPVRERKAMHFSQLSPWAIPPTKYDLNLSAAREKRKLSAESFTYIRAERQPEFCPPWVQGATLGWRISSPTDITLSPLRQVEITGGEQTSESARAVGMNQVWIRDSATLAVEQQSWLTSYEFETSQGSQTMFLPNGLGTVEWRLGWSATTADDFGLLVIPSPETPDLGVQIGLFSSTTIKRLHGTGMSIAISPRRELTLSRGDEIARLVPSSREALNL